MHYPFLNIIGLMTGTSADGIDISLVRTNGLDLERLNKNYFYEYSLNTKNEINDILKCDIYFNLERKKYLDEFVTREHYCALKNLDIVKTCDLIGFHGQTIYHNPDNNISIQLGDPKSLAKLLKKNVVFDFRSNDLKFGGQGAPLAPVYHKFIIEMHDLPLPSCILNIGGVSNITYWDGNNLIGFDTGPGNALMNDYMLNKFNENFDKNGKIASKGTPIKSELEKFLKHDFFKTKPPKSLDRNEFSFQYTELIKKKISVNDIMATLAEFTIESIVKSLEILPKNIDNMIVTGGGYKNTYLMRRLKERLKLKILNEKELGIDFDFIEAELIAYLSARCIYKIPYTFPSTTGVLKPTLGGELHKYL